MANEQRAIEPIARQMNRSPIMLRSFLDRAEQATQGKRLKRRRAAEFIRRLAIIRRAAKK